MKIIVTGSLGNISRPLTHALVETGHQVVVISSDLAKQAAIEGLGASAAIGSVTDADFLTEAFQDADAVYTMVPPNFAAADPLSYYEQVGRCYATAIQASGIKRVVQLSSWGAHLQEGTGIISGSHRVEQILNQVNGASITHLRPCSFYNNLYLYTDMIKTQGFIATNYGGEDKVVWVSPRDIAAVAVGELVARPAKNTIRYVASDERSCNEVASILGAAIGKPDLRWLALSDEQVRAAMEKNGLPQRTAALLVELNASIRTGLIRQDYDLHQPAMGTVKIEDFALEFAAAFE
jgi:uncharacterized protein YbjT (DUF2867 family)